MVPREMVGGVLACKKVGQSMVERLKCHVDIRHGLGNCLRFRFDLLGMFLVWLEFRACMDGHVKF